MCRFRYVFMSMHVYRQYLSLSPTRQELTQGLFYSGSFREGESRAGTEIHTLLVYSGHWFTECNVSLVNQLGL